MIILEDISAVPVTADMLVGALQVLAGMTPRAEPALRSKLIHAYAETVVPANSAGAMALAIGWRLDALAAFLISPSGRAWTTLNGPGPLLLNPTLLDSAAGEPLIRGNKTAAFDNGRMLSRLAISINGLNDGADVPDCAIGRH
jgi:hypothetical protein